MSREEMRVKEEVKRWNEWSQGGAAKQKKILSSSANSTPKTTRTPSKSKKKNQNKTDSVKKTSITKKKKYDEKGVQLNIKEMIKKIEAANKKNKDNKAEKDREETWVRKKAREWEESEKDVREKTEIDRDRRLQKVASQYVEQQLTTDENSENSSSRNSKLDLTIFNCETTPKKTFWGKIGTIGGAEENRFFRRSKEGDFKKANQKEK